VLSVEYYSTASSYLHTPKHSTKKGCRTASSQHLKIQGSQVVVGGGGVGKSALTIQLFL